MSYYTLVLSFQYHDSSVALFCDDKLIHFIQAERDSRKKGDSNIDLKSVNYIFDNITTSIDLLVIKQKIDNDIIGSRTIQYVMNKFQCKTILGKSNDDFDDGLTRGLSLNKTENTTYSHHCIHAMSSFYMSPFDEAVCLVIDGAGTSFTVPYSERLGVVAFETTSILEIDKNYRRTFLYKRGYHSPVKFVDDTPLPFLNILHYPNNKNPLDNLPYECDLSGHIDIGVMWEIITKHIGYFKLEEAGKTMGLSAYGKPNENIPKFLVNDTIYSDKNLFVMESGINKKAFPHLHRELTFQEKADLSYELQKSLEKIFLHHVEFIKKNSKIRNLVLSGGCVLNILGVSLIKEKYPEFNIFVDPIAHDGTQAIGLGIHYYNVEKMKGKLEKKNHFNSIYLGPEYDKSLISDTIDGFMKYSQNESV